MSSRGFQIGDIVQFRQDFIQPPERPWGSFEVVGRKSRKFFWLRDVVGLGRRLNWSRKAHWRHLVLVTPVEERVAEILMGEE